jgi:hypothetical protein
MVIFKVLTKDPVSSGSGPSWSWMPSPTPATGGYQIPADADADAALRTAFNDLLRRAQQAGAIRSDITPDDLQALVVGCVATARHRGDTKLVQILITGLRA